MKCPSGQVWHPFTDWEGMSKAENLSFFTDASKMNSWGLAVIFDGEWSYGQWEQVFVRCHDPSIEYLELFALVVGVMIWSKKLKGRNVIIHCVNQAMVEMG